MHCIYDNTNFNLQAVIEDLTNVPSVPCENCHEMIAISLLRNHGLNCNGGSSLVVECIVKDEPDNVDMPSDSDTKVDNLAMF